MENTMSRRTALLSAAVSTVALAVPVQATTHANDDTAAINIEELAEQFRESAMKLDPRINECWVGYDELADGPRDMRVMHVYFGRKDTPFLKPAPPRMPRITDLFEQWQEVKYDPARHANETGEEGNARFARYGELQDKILATRPRSVREVAMQFVVETDDGINGVGAGFFQQIRLVAMGI